MVLPHQQEMTGAGRDTSLPVACSAAAPSVTNDSARQRFAPEWARPRCKALWRPVWEMSLPQHHPVQAAACLLLLAVHVVVPAGCLQKQPEQSISPPTFGIQHDIRMCSIIGICICAVVSGAHQLLLHSRLA